MVVFPAIVANLGNWTVSIIIFGAFILAAFAIKFFLQRIVSIFTSRTRTIIDDLIIRAIVLPVFLFLIIGGLWIGLSRTPELTPYLSIIHKVFASVFIVIGAIAITRVINAILTWYGIEVATRTKSDVDDKLIPLLRRVVIFVIYVLGLLFILQVWNVNISALLAA